MSFKKFFTLVILLLALASCERNYEGLQSMNLNLEPRAYIKVVNNTVNSSRMILFVDGAKISGATSSANIAFNSGTFSSSNFPQSLGGYVSLPAGLRSIVLRDTSSTTTLRSINISASLEPNSYYSIYTADSVNNATGQLIQDDNFNSIDTSITRVRFAHMAFAPGGAPAVLFGTRRLGTLFNNVANKQVSNYVNYKSNVVDSVYVVRASNVRDTLVRQAFSFMANRPYTIVFRGRFNLTTAYNLNTNFFGRRMELVAQDRFPF